MRTDELQARLRALGFDPGPTDGIYGELTEEAVFDCLDRYTPPIPPPSTLIPPEWMPACSMQRVVCHWTAGAHTASSHDLNYYHILIENDGKLVRGIYSIKDNVETSDGRYAAHTKSLNTGSIGISLCCMAGAIESPFSAGQYPMTSTQWDVLATVVAELCETYDIPIEPETVLSHAEVEGTLGVDQSGKWDFTKLAFNPAISGAKACGDLPPGRGLRETMIETALLATLVHRLAHLLDRLEHMADQRAPERPWHALGGWWPPHSQRWSERVSGLPRAS